MCTIQASHSIFRLLYNSLALSLSVLFTETEHEWVLCFYKQQVSCKIQDNNLFVPTGIPRWDWNTQNQVSRENTRVACLPRLPVACPPAPSRVEPMKHVSFERTKHNNSMVWKHRQKEFKPSWEHEKFCTCTDYRGYFFVTCEGRDSAVFDIESTMTVLL